MSHLEDLIAEYYIWQDYIVKRNVKVGKLSHGGWEMELDVIAYHPHTNHLVHLEPSIDAHSWDKRKQRFTKKFNAGRKYIFESIFTWLDKETPLEQIAILISHPKNRDTLAGAAIRSIDEMVSDIRNKIIARGIVAKDAIPEQYPLLRTLQMSHNGYYRYIE